MGQQTKNASQSGKRQSSAPSERRARVSQNREKHQESWIQGKRPILRFVLVFAILVIPFNIYYYASFAKSDAFDAYLSLNARASAAIVRVFGTEATAQGQSLFSPKGAALSIAQGCDAIQPAALFFSAVAASPVLLRRKLPGLLIGTGLLLVLNLVRIITLFYTQIHIPDLFEFMHIEFWQALFIFLALLFWVIWASWAKRVTMSDAKA